MTNEDEGLSELGEVTLKRALEDFETEEGRKRLEDGMQQAYRMCIYLFNKGTFDSTDTEWFGTFMKKAYDEFYPESKI